jgi:ATP-binding cassette subfamily C protein
MRALFDTGVARAVAGNAPFLLEGVNRVWLVRTGQLELFLVRTGDETQRGMRHHFMSAQAGDLLFGMDTDLGLGLLASGVVGTEVVEVSLAMLQAAVPQAAVPQAAVPQAAVPQAAVPDDLIELSAGIDRWVTAVSAGVTRHITPKPRADVLLMPGTSEPVTQGQRVRPARGVAWLRQVTGASLFIDMEETAGGDTSAAVPMRVPATHDTWLQLLQSSTVETVDTVTAWRDASLWPGLQTLHGLVLSCELFNTSLVAVDEYNRLTEKAARRLQAQQAALAQLTAVLGGTMAPPVPSDASDDPLFLACAAVGRATGITMRVPTKRTDDARARAANPLVEIAKASQTRTRPVQLTDKWWGTDQGALLGFLQGSGAPVGLLPTSHASYSLYDPTAGTTTPITPTVASTIAPGATMFYPSMAAEAITGARLLALGLRDCGPDLWRVLMMALLGGIVGIVMPLATGLIFDTLVPQSQRGGLMQVGLGLGMVSIAAALFTVTRSLAMLRVENRLDSTINAAVMDRVLRLPASFFRQYSSGDLGTRTMAFSSIRQALSGAVIGTVFTGITALPSVGLLVYYDPRLSLVAMAVLLLTVAVTVGVGYRQLQRAKVEQRLEGKLSGIVLELLTGISKLRVAGAEAFAFGVWAATFSEKRRVAFQAGMATNLLAAFQGALPVLGVVAVFGGVAFSTTEGGMSTGTFLAFNAAFTQVLMAAISLGTAAMTVLSVQPLYQRVRPILDAVPEVTAEQQDPGELSGEIALSRVTFRYDTSGPPVLDDVSLHISPGEFVAIVGPSGSGKSTLLRLLLGFETPDRGTVEYDGQNLAALDVSAVRRQLGVVLQHSKIMPGDIYRNIVGSTLLTIDDAWDAARRAALEEDITLMPMGMHTMISEGGGTFSGGQRQRLLIARALAQGPRVLFFDEATSALDNATQAVVSASLDRLQATRVVIAHRLSTVINADRIYVMVAGRIVQTGSYQALMQEDGVFSELVRRQLV